MNYSEENNEKELEKQKRVGKKARNKTLIIIARVVLFIIVIGFFAIIGIVMGAYIGIIDKAPKIEYDLQPDIYTTILYVDETGEEYDRYEAKENREYVTLDKISPYMRDAIVAIEDERFYDHDGIDIKGIFRAAYVMLTSSDREGASTITQQLVKNNVTKVSKNTLETKLQEQFLAIEYEKTLVKELKSKEKAKAHILELYLNTIPLNHNLNGVQTASDFYFGIDASELSLAESAALAAITKHPTKYTPVNHPEENQVRQRTVLKRMLEQEYITEEEYNQALEEDIYSGISGFAKAKQAEGKVHSYYADQVFESASRDLQKKLNISPKEASTMLYNKGYSIYVPIDKEMQRIVDETVNNAELFPAEAFNIEVTYYVTFKNTLTDKLEHKYKKIIVANEEEIPAFEKSARDELQGPNHVFESDRTDKVIQPQISFLVVDYHNGYVKAVAGGRGEKTMNRSFNRATQATRQPGSVFKIPAAYAPALELGYANPATVIDDVPYVFPGNPPYTPKNHWGENTYRGLTPMRTAIETSANVATVKLMSDVGIDNVYNFLLKLGFTTLVGDIVDGKTDKGLSTSLGGLTNGVYQSEVAAAYGSIANLGVKHETKFYTKVFDHDGNLILDNSTKEPERVFSEGNAYILTDMMRDVITGSRGTGGAARFQNISMPIAGKTGTTSDTVDLTFVGYTPYYLGTVWFGYDNSDPLTKKLYNQRYHMVIWRTIMEQIHANLPEKEFPKPENIISASVCRDSGLLPGSLCSNDPRGNRIVSELFISGTQPSKTCDIHASKSVCSVSGQQAGPFCPQGSVSSGVGIVRRTPYTGTGFVEDSVYEIGSRGQLCTLHTEDYVPEEVPATEDIDEIDNNEEPTTEPTTGQGETPTAPVTTTTPPPVETEAPATSVGNPLPNIEIPQEH